jgi:hypothetical protein
MGVAVGIGVLVGVAVSKGVGVGVTVSVGVGVRVKVGVMVNVSVGRATIAGTRCPASSSQADRTTSNSRRIIRTTHLNISNYYATG